MSNGKALVYNQEKCTGCRSCVVGCSLYHDGECGKVVSRVAVVRNERFGESFVVGCDMCTDAPCAAVCPTGACAMDHGCRHHQNRCQQVHRLQGMRNGMPLRRHQHAL